MMAEPVATDDASMPAAGVAELDREWAEIEAGAPTVPHEKVARWLETWGTAAFMPWHGSASA
jgi:predicted transcriptional regulator